MNAEKFHTDWWNEFRNGSRDAFEKIYNYYVHDLLKYGYRVTTDSQLIRDTIQDLFLHLWHSRSKLCEPNSVQFYLYKALRNRIADSKEKSQKERFVLARTLTKELFQQSMEDKTILEEEEENKLNKLKKSILQLPKRQQEMIQLRYFHGFTSEEASRIMGISPQSVRNLLYRTILDLRRQCR